MKHATSAAVCVRIAALFLSSAAFGQLPAPQYEIGVHAGTLIYQGDLTPSATGSFKTPSAVFGINGSRRLTKVLAARLNLSFGRLRGADSAYSSPEWRKQRAFGFTTPVTEVTASMVIYPFGTERRLSPYFLRGWVLLSWPSNAATAPTTPRIFRKRKG